MVYGDLEGQVLFEDQQQNSLVMEIGLLDFEVFQDYIGHSSFSNQIQVYDLKNQSKLCAYKCDYLQGFRVKFLNSLIVNYGRGGVASFFDYVKEDKAGVLDLKTQFLTACYQKDTLIFGDTTGNLHLADAQHFKILEKLNISKAPL